MMGAAHLALTATLLTAALGLSLPSTPAPSPAYRAVHDLLAERGKLPLAVLGARRLVVGHTVQPRISCACDCTVFRVDVGLSRAMGGGLPQALEIGVDGTVRVLAARA